jgi:methyl-accepting chemotaxis protein
MMTLSRKFNLALIAGVTAVLALFAVYNIHTQKQKLNAQLANKVDNIKTRLQVSLPGPIWDFSISSVAKLVEAESADPEVIRIDVKDVNGKLIQEDDQNSKNKAKTNKVKEELSWTVPLFHYEGQSKEKVGEAIIYMSDKVIEDNINQSIYSTLITIGIIDIIILLLANMSLQRLVIGPVNQINQRLKDIANGNGDLTQAVNYSSNDEFGDLTINFNQFVDSIRGTVADVLTHSEHLKTATVESASSITDMNNQVGQQEIELSSLVAALHQMTQTSHEIARSALETANLVQGSKTAADGGNIKLEDAATANIRLVEDVQAAVDVIEDLEKEVDSISSILDVIRNIAEQTNLLALNAAIEAARAGEQGRGFAVVADEVRNLAQRTQDATGEIQTMIELLQDKSRKAVSVMEAGAKATELSQEKTHSAGESFNEIVDFIEKSLIHADQIAAAAEQQTATMGEIDRNVVNIGVSQKELVMAADSNRNLISQSESISLDLSQLMRKFKV